MTPLLGLVVVLGRPATKPLDMVPQVLGDVGVPTQVVGQTQDMAAVVDTAESMCGSKEMDDYFNEHSGGATERWLDRHRNVWNSCASHTAPCAARHAVSRPQVRSAASSRSAATRIAPATSSAACTRPRALRRMWRAASASRRTTATLAAASSMRSRRPAART